MDIAARFVTPALVFVLTLASGVWLSRSGKPLPTGVFTIHKLIALAAVISAAMQVYTALKTTEIQALLGALIVVAGLCVVTLFVTGALMSLGKPLNGAVLTVHKVAPFVAATTLVAAIYLLAAM